MEDERIIEPLLYIDQPELQGPKAYMQDDYVGLTGNEIINEEVTPTEKVQVESHSFKQLTINEKIDYLVNLPSEVPRIRCEVEMDDGKFKGLIVEENEQDITMKIFGRENKQIKKADIKNILLLGF